jgi:hypothetical protein
LPEPSETPRAQRNPWVRTFWIVFAIIVGVIVLSWLAMQTLTPS